MLVTMRLSRFPGVRLAAPVLLFLLVGGLLAGRTCAQASAVTITPAVVVAGSPVLIHVEAPATAKINGEWMGHTLQFFPARKGNGWFALAGIDVENSIGPSTLQIKVNEGGGVRDLSRTVEIIAAHYRTGSLTVAPRFVEPSPDELKRIKEEAQLKEKVFAASASEPLWSGNFRAPVTATPTDRSEEHTSELQSLRHLVCRLLLEKKRRHVILGFCC